MICINAGHIWHSMCTAESCQIDSPFKCISRIYSELSCFKARAKNASRKSAICVHILMLFLKQDPLNVFWQLAGRLRRPARVAGPMGFCLKAREADAAHARPRPALDTGLPPVWVKSWTDLGLIGLTKSSVMVSWTFLVVNQLQATKRIRNTGESAVLPPFGFPVNPLAPNRAKWRGLGVRAVRTTFDP